MLGRRIKLIDWGCRYGPHKIIITTLTGHRYLSRRRSTMITVVRRSY